LSVIFSTTEHGTAARKAAVGGQARRSPNDDVSLANATAKATGKSESKIHQRCRTHDSAPLSHGGRLSTRSGHILLMVVAAIGILAAGAGQRVAAGSALEYQRCTFALGPLHLLLAHGPSDRCWLVRIAPSFFGLTMIVSILVVSTFKKFAKGGKDRWKAESLRLTN
jgi:hypothetical protein